MQESWRLRKTQTGIWRLRHRMHIRGPLVVPSVPSRSRIVLPILDVYQLLVWRYFRRGGGLAMLRMMNAPAEMGHAHAHPAA